ncbi:hypothetical protein BDR07DRAFT_1376805 [Suillus spraguei]|nr:hypothetical protein BDR07DRAFT_1376805 [Suillus spraguei]
MAACYIGKTLPALSIPTATLLVSFSSSSTTMSLFLPFSCPQFLSDFEQDFCRPMIIALLAAHKYIHWIPHIVRPVVDVLLSSHIIVHIIAMVNEYLSVALMSH